MTEQTQDRHLDNGKDEANDCPPLSDDDLADWCGQITGDASLEDVLRAAGGHLLAEVNRLQAVQAEIAQLKEALREAETARNAAQARRNFEIANYATVVMEGVMDDIMLAGNRKGAERNARQREIEAIAAREYYRSELAETATASAEARSQVSQRAKRSTADLGSLPVPYIDRTVRQLAAPAKSVAATTQSLPDNTRRPGRRPVHKYTRG